MDFWIDPASRVPIYRQLAHQLREKIARGTLQPGQRLPSVRELSRTLVVNPNTIARVYTELEREGMLNTRPGLGVFIAEPRVELAPEVCDQRLREAIDRLLTEAVHLGFSKDEVLQRIRETVKQYQWPGQTP